MFIENVIYKILAPSERHVKHRSNMPLRWSLISQHNGFVYKHIAPDGAFHGIFSKKDGKRKKELTNPERVIER